MVEVEHAIARFFAAWVLTVLSPADDSLTERFPFVALEMLDVVLCVCHFRLGSFSKITHYLACDIEKLACMKKDRPFVEYYLGPDPIFVCASVLGCPYCYTQQTRTGKGQGHCGRTSFLT